MKLLAILLLFVCHIAYTQTYSVTGTVVGGHNALLESGEIKLRHGDSVRVVPFTDRGLFTIGDLAPGHYHISIAAEGYEIHVDSFVIKDANINLGSILLCRVIHMLSEVSVVEKVLAMVQKDDTLEYNSAAYKLNPDADAADLVKKMPGVQINNKEVTAQGENVVKVLVDGKPFFGTDPYGSLKNLPADIIAKVQVYNERSDQERFTGFKEGSTAKTVNIITKPGRRKGLFGKAYAGGGADNSSSAKYGAGLVLNKFGGDRRITLTMQSNNVNEQNFTSENPGIAAGSGTAVTHAAGINYTDKWGKRLDASVSYNFSNVNNDISRQLNKTFVLPADSGQVYNESNPSTGNNYSHRFNIRIDHTIDTLNSLLFAPSFSLNQNSNSAFRTGETYTGDALAGTKEKVNSTSDDNNTETTGYTLTGSLLFRHKFHKKRRTLSIGANTNSSGSRGATLHGSQNVYYNSPALNTNIDQQVSQQQATWHVAANAAYTEPVKKNGLLKLEYSAAYTPSNSEKNTGNYSALTNAYTLYDSSLSNTFHSSNMAHKAGAAYQLHFTNTDFSLGLNYQYTTLSSNQSTPYAFSLRQHFQNLLPVASFSYKFSKTKNLQCNYNTTTQTPSVSQLQNVVNNTDPIRLSVGNPALKQPFRHHLTIRYNASGGKNKNNFFVSVNGSYTQNYITSYAVTATADTVIAQNISMAKGAQLVTPVNIDGFSSLHANVNYGMPLAFIKCHMNLGLNAGISNTPALFNGQTNYQQNTNGSLNLSVSSNIGEHIDFSVASSLSVVANTNSLNRQLNNTFFNTSSNASLNIIFLKSFVFNTAVNYQSNAGLATGFDQNYFIWNLGIGKKVFKKQQGDIRLSAFNLLNEQTNIQHTVTDTYIQDTRSNILQRYFLLVFTYKLREFSK